MNNFDVKITNNSSYVIEVDRNADFDDQSITINGKGQTAAYELKKGTSAQLGATYDPEGKPDGTMQIGVVFSGPNGGLYTLTLDGTADGTVVINNPFDESFNNGKIEGDNDPKFRVTLAASSKEIVFTDI